MGGAGRWASAPLGLIASAFGPSRHFAPPHDLGRKPGIAEADGTAQRATLVARSGRFSLRVFDLRHRAVCFETIPSVISTSRTLIRCHHLHPIPVEQRFGTAPWVTPGASQQAVISDVFTSVTTVSLGAAAAKQGEHVIDIGCGTGDTLLAFARAATPFGRCVGVSISGLRCCEFARHRAPRRDLAT